MQTGIKAARAERTKKAILDAAEEIFAQKGLSGARVDEIAEKAGANKHMIYEYFVNKEELYKTVLADVYGRLGDNEAPVIDESERIDPEQAIRSLIDIYFDFLRNNRSYVRMILWENIHEAKYFDQMNLGAVRNPIRRSLRTIIAHGQQSGVFRADLDGDQILMSLFALSFNYFSNIHTMSRVMDADLPSEAQVNRRKEDIIQMLLHYMLAASL